MAIRCDSCDNDFFELFKLDNSEVCRRCYHDNIGLWPEE